MEGNAPPLLLVTHINCNTNSHEKNGNKEQINVKPTSLTKTQNN
jgi:hypothetical protein